MIIKNLKKYFSFEVQVLDDKNVRRRFRASNYQVSGGAACVRAMLCRQAGKQAGMLCRQAHCTHLDPRCS